jgi:ribosome maturation factor RimP
MADSELKTLILSDIQPIVKGMGFDIVELRVNHGKLLDIELIVYNPIGVSVENCADISGNIYPRIELLPGCEKFVLKVTSPGISRLLKSKDEYRIFRGKGIKILFPNESEWVTGIIGETSESGFTFITGQDTQYVDYTAIKRAKLDSNQGGFN